VVVQATLTGAANLRSVPAPRFRGSIRGDVRIEGGEVSTAFEAGHVIMTRRWRYLLFPEEAGLLEIPAMSLTTFLPSSGSRKVLQCDPGWMEAITAARAQPPGGVEEPSSPTPLAQSRAVPWVAGGVLGALFAALAVPRAWRGLVLRREVLAIVDGKSAAEIRSAVEERLGAVPQDLLAERSDRGDAYRALRSLLDAVDKDRDLAVDCDEEVARRVREVLTIGR
jgi:hypothetical protein